jgi:hypothetical protein
LEKVLKDVKQNGKREKADWIGKILDKFRGICRTQRYQRKERRMAQWNVSDEFVKWVKLCDDLKGMEGEENEIEVVKPPPSSSKKKPAKKTPKKRGGKRKKDVDEDDDEEKEERPTKKKKDLLLEDDFEPAGSQPLKSGPKRVIAAVREIDFDSSP